MPRYLLQGDETMSRFMHQSLMDQNFDLAFSNELKVDHSIVCPIITLRPQNDLPIVPIYTNIFAPPLASPRRFYDLGRLSSRQSTNIHPRKGWRLLEQDISRWNWVDRDNSWKLVPILYLIAGNRMAKSRRCRRHSRACHTRKHGEKRKRYSRFSELPADARSGGCSERRLCRQSRSFSHDGSVFHLVSAGGKT